MRPGTGTRKGQTKLCKKSRENWSICNLWKKSVNLWEKCHFWTSEKTKGSLKQGKRARKLSDHYDRISKIFHPSYFSIPVYYSWSNLKNAQFFLLSHCKCPFWSPHSESTWFDHCLWYESPKLFFASETTFDSQNRNKRSAVRSWFWESKKVEKICRKKWRVVICVLHLIYIYRNGVFLRFEQSIVAWWDHTVWVSPPPHPPPAPPQQDPHIHLSSYAILNPPLPLGIPISLAVRGVSDVGYAPVIFNSSTGGWFGILSGTHEKKIVFYSCHGWK